MEFDEKDIKAVGQRRFWKRWIKRTIFVFSVGFGGMFGVVGAFSAGYLSSGFIIIAPAACLVVWMLYMFKQEEKFKKDFVEQCKKEGIR